MEVQPNSRWGSWTALSPTESTTDRRRCWLCRCACGLEKKVAERYLLTGLSRSCGKCQHEDLAGSTYGYLRVLGLARKEKCGNSSKTYWICRCSCGNAKPFIARGDQLKNGSSRHCGCRRRRPTSLGSVDKKADEAFPFYTHLRMVWLDMKRRCLRTDREAHARYGARGITVCAEWLHDFGAFYIWATHNGYTPGLTLDRADNNGNYEPSNCRWSTYKEQSRNKSNNRLTPYLVAEIRRRYAEGVRQCILARDYGLSHQSVHKVVRRHQWV